MIQALLLSLVLSAQPAAPAPVVAFRTRLTVGDPDRNWTYISSADSSLEMIWKVGGKPYQSWPLPAVDSFYDGSIHGGFTLPDGIQPGNIAVDCGHPITIQVIKAPDRKAVSVPTTYTALQVQALILSNPGPLDITLAPGLHKWDRMVTLPANTRLDGQNVATIKRLPANNGNNNWATIYVSGADVSIYGVTFINDNPGGMVLWTNNATVDGLVVGDCVIRRCNLGFFFAHSLVRDCWFDGGGAIIAPQGLFWNCRYTGPSKIDPHQWWWASCSGSMMVDCSFDKTQRGPVFNAAGQTVSDVLFCGVECHGIVRGNNGNECWVCEAGPINRLTALHCRVMGCDSASFQLDGGGSDCFVRDFVQDGGIGINITSWNKGATTTNFVLQDFELRRCGGICLGPTVSGFQAIDGSIISFTPTRGNQPYQNSAPTGYLRTTAALAEGSNVGTNTLIRVPIIKLGVGFTSVTGFKIVP